MSEWNAMTYDGKATILRVVRDEAERMFALAGRPEIWESPTACAGWSTRDVVGHIIDTTEGYFRAFDAARGAGELLLRNPTVTPGYWRMPEQTEATVVRGWLHTGDLVTAAADGTYTFVSRVKEVIRRRGLNLSPTEVEEAIATHPDVLEVAVVAVPSELTEDEVKAFVVMAPGRSVDFAELRAWTAARLSAFKVPRFWQALDALPRTPTSRVAKHRLPVGHPDEEYDAEP